MPLEQRAVPRREVERALHLEHLPRLGEIGLAVLDLTAERGEGGALGVEHLRHPPVDRKPAEIAAPGDAYALEVAPERRAKAVARLGDGVWRATIGARHHAQHERHVHYGARHGPGHV